METVERNNSLPGGPQPKGPEASLSRRILMFPLTRLLIAVATIVPLVLLPAYGAMALLDAPQGTSYVEFFFEHRAFAACVQALAVVGALVFVGTVVERRPFR